MKRRYWETLFWALLLVSMGGAAALFTTYVRGGK